MARHFVIIALFIGICACLRTSQLAAQNECSDLRVYFAVADARMGEQFIALIEDDEWMARMDAAITKANHSEMSILVLSPDEMDAFATFLSVPGDVLLSMEVNDEVPKIANELHNSALELWLLFPPMMRSVASGGIFGAFPFAEEIESLEAENLEAQITLRQRCPAEIAAAESFAEEAAQRNGALDILEPETMTDLSPAAFKGTAFQMLFFSEFGDSGTLPLPDPTPNNQTDDIAVAQTKVAESRATLAVQETMDASENTLDAPEEPGSGSFTLSDAPFYSDGTLWGSPDDRLGYDDGVIFSNNPDGYSLGRDDVEVQAIPDDQGQSLAICDAGNECIDATSDSANGPHTDEPIGWVDGRLIYQRIDNGNGQPVEIRAVEWNGEPISDEALGAIDNPIDPLGAAYPVDAGTLIPASSSWLLISDGSARIAGQNPYGDIQLVRANFGDDLITYVAGGQVIVATASSPGDALSSIPFNGVDYDLSERNQAVVISTGSGLEIYDLGGSLIAASDTSVATGSVLWLRDGIVFIDKTNSAIRTLDPAMFRQ